MDHNGPQPQNQRHNAVLRGGPLDGETLTVDRPNIVVRRTVGGETYGYRPTGTTDEEYPNLVVFVYDKP